MDDDNGTGIYHHECIELIHGEIPDDPLKGGDRNSSGQYRSFIIAPFYRDCNQYSILKDGARSVVVEELIFFDKICKQGKSRLQPTGGSFGIPVMSVGVDVIHGFIDKGESFLLLSQEKKTFF